MLFFSPISLSLRINYIGEKMKKYSIIIVSLAVFIVAIVLCLCIRDKYELMTYEIDTETFVYEFSEKEIEKELDMDVEWLKEYKVLSSLSNLEYERILLFHVEEGYMDQVKKKADAYTENLLNQFPDDVQEIIENTKKFEKDDNFIIVVSKNADTIIEKLKERLIE